MKDSMSSVDVAAIVTELQELVGARFVKAYQHGKDEIRLKLHQKDKGSLDLIIEAGKRIHLTKYKRPSPRMPSNFAMYIRKHLSGGRIAQIQQLDFDRIVELTIERWDTRTKLIAELLPRGNLVLVDENGDIMLPLRRKSFATRELKVRKRYERPPSRANTLTLRELDLIDLCRSAAQDKDVVRLLAAELSLGGLYAEEICEHAGVEKNKNAHDLTEAEVSALFAALKAVLAPIIAQEKTHFKPQIVLEAHDEKLDVLPFALHAYDEKEKQFFNSFNEAADEFFTSQLAEAVEEEAKSEHEKGISKHEHVLEEQLAALEKFERKEAECIQKGELIYTRYVELETMLQEMPKKRKVETVTLPDTDLQLELDTSVSLHKNASAYYERAKTFRKKREGVERAIEETKARIEAEKAKEVEIAEERLPEKKEEVVRVKEEWYEKFRWFETSDGFLVIGGKDATTNELVVKKYMASNDVFCHTQAEGAPVVIAKTGGKEISEEGLREIAQFAASYSALWKYGFYEGECYCVSGEQVSKTPPSGEYLKKGAFMVRGKRQYFKAALGLCIGIKKDKMVVVPATEAQKEQMEMYVELAPEGELEKNELAKEIVKFFVDNAKEDRKEEIERIAQYEKVLRYLPPGKSRIQGSYP
ncbi:MAG: NFACT family protein [Methanomicrobia archaeon]|nr:NFACT family protein [Methanomicrobia archaeon]